MHTSSLLARCTDEPHVVGAIACAVHVAARRGLDGESTCGSAAGRMPHVRAWHRTLRISAQSQTLTETRDPFASHIDVMLTHWRRSHRGTRERTEHRPWHVGSLAHPHLDASADPRFPAQLRIGVWAIPAF